MRKRVPIKNHQQEKQLITNRSAVAIIIFGLMILTLTARLAYLQIYKHRVYSTLSRQNWLDLVPIEPTRGLIYDRNGVLLANNLPVFSLDIIPYKTNDLDRTLVELGKLIQLTDNDISEFRKQLRQHRRFDELPLKFRLSEEEVARFTENQYRFPGVFIKGRLLRSYPQSTTFSHVLGYVGRINTQELKSIDQVNYSASNYIGKIGIERYYEKALHGNVGYQQVETDASGKAIRILKEIKSQPGKNLYLTIDSNLQLAAEKSLKGLRGSIVAIDPSNGQVLALVSNPGFDPNLFVTGISRKDYKELQQSLDKPLFNRSIRGLYPPASTIKPFIALKGLDSETITPDDTIEDIGWFQLPNYSHRYHDWRPRGHGTVDITRAIIQSCDTYFYRLADTMGIRKIDDMLNDFGFGTATGIDLNDELSGVVASPEWKRYSKHTSWYDGDTIISGIGQGYMQSTPLQLATATAALSMRGQRYLPYLMLGEQEPDGTFIAQPPISLDPIELEDDGDWEIVIKAMQGVVTSPQGTGFRFGRNHTYTIAAKTGTAQVVAKRGSGNEVDNQSNLPERMRDHHLFIAFAPADKPKIALAVITENSNSAVVAAKNVMDTFFNTQKPDSERNEK